MADESPAAAPQPVDLTALNTVPQSGQGGLPAIDFPGMGDLNANVESAESSRGVAQGGLDEAIADTPIAPQPEQFNGEPPQRQIGHLMQMSPWLIMLGAFGGARTGAGANAMLAATNGMIQGINAGDEQGFQDAYAKYQAEHQKFAELQKQKWDVYREMVKVYKDRIDGKQRALQVAEQAVRDARKDRSDTMMAYMQTVRAGVQLKDINRKLADTESNIAHRKEEDRIRQEEVDRKTAKDAQGGPSGTKATAKKEEHEKAVRDATTDIDQLINMLKSDNSVVGMTGLGGKARRVGEAVANVTGASNDTRAARFEERLEKLRLKVAPILSGSNRTAKDQREKIDKVVRGLKAGDTRQNTIDALNDLKDDLKNLTPAEDQFEVGKAYTNPKGQTAVYLGEGKWRTTSTPPAQ